MKLKVLYFFTFFICSNILFAQIPLRVGVGLGFAIPLSDYSGTTIDYYSGSKYGLSTGFNVHGKIIADIEIFSLEAILEYSSISNSGETEPGKGKVEISQDIFSIKLGPEFSFSLTGIPLKPYIWPNLAFNHISGKTDFNGVTEVPSGNHTMSSTWRTGLGLGVGAAFDVSSSTSIDFAIHYNLINLIGKDFESVEEGKVKRLDSYLSLNDAKDPNYEPGNSEHFISDKRAISTFDLTIAIMFEL